ncbi:MAG TPA: hypothetical protein VGF86_04460 [Candidatus Tumulicola sp.]|jgi:hypothetical protein
MRVLIFALAIAGLTACSSHKTTVQTSEGSATVTTSQDDKNVTVSTGEGTTSIGERADAAKLGAPIYPGAQADQQGSISTTSDKGTSTIAAFKTADAFEKVYEYYKQQLPADAEKMKVSSTNGSVVSFQIGGESSSDEVSVQVSSDKPNETDILITHVVRSAGPAAATPAPTPSA